MFEHAYPMFLEGTSTYILDIIVCFRNYSKKCTTTTRKPTCSCLKPGRRSSMLGLSEGAGLSMLMLLVLAEGAEAQSFEGTCPKLLAKFE